MKRNERAVQTPDWVKKWVPANILKHLKPIKNTRKTGGRLFTFFAVRSGVEIEVYKKVYGHGSTTLATLGLLPGTVICINNGGNYKQRANQAEVRAFASRNHLTWYSGHDNTFAYRIGLPVKPKNGFNMDPTGECEPGIHFFFSKQQALSY